jgi:hypothetical protein
MAGVISAGNIDYLLDGSPGQPYRTNFPRTYPFVAAGLTATAQTGWVVPVVCQQGDVITSVTIGVKTATSSTPTHGWAALYTGLATASTLIAQSADDTSGFHGSASAQTFTLSTPHLVGTDPGSSGTSGPTVLGVLLYNDGGAGGVLDAISVGSEAVAGSVFVTGQVPLLFTKASMAAGATAPATLSGFAAAAAAFVTPFVLLH